MPKGPNGQKLPGDVIGAAIVDAKEGRPMTEADVEWLRQRRVGTPAKEDAGAFVSRMRDEDNERLLPR